MFDSTSTGVNCKFLNLWDIGCIELCFQGNSMTQKTLSIQYCELLNHKCTIFQNSHEKMLPGHRICSYSWKTR